MPSAAIPFFSAAQQQTASTTYIQNALSLYYGYHQSGQIHTLTSGIKAPFQKRSLFPRFPRRCGQVDLAGAGDGDRTRDVQLGKMAVV